MIEERMRKKMFYWRGKEDKLSHLEFDQQIQEISKFIQQQCKSENLHFLIGSGCSLPHVPLMSKTFDNIKSNTEISSCLGDYAESNDIEGYLNWLKNAMTFLQSGDEYNKYAKAFKKTKESLLLTIPKSYTGLSEAENIKLITTSDNYKKFYNSILSHREYKDFTPINIFTTNYDLYNEIAMEQNGIHYANGFRGLINRTFDPQNYRMRLVDDENRYKEKWTTVKRFIKLHKIHGSIDWNYDTNLKTIVQSSNSLSKEGNENVMIYPTINKHLETQQSPYSELMREFTINLQKRDSTLIVIGYGFPDSHINQLISQALNNDDFNLIVFGDKTEQNAKEFYNENKDRNNFHFIEGNYNNNKDGHHFNNVIKFLGGFKL
ncbi:SIR2 family protein [Alkalicoccus daliensis]|uniref:SIR2-like domain-containing protein n=1 Tax=Alkalicoccus daliensis TaxID=745820 RepID=A0A1H0JXU0_9BACI|nr:SIR2 family protein [Alkalicoccus daliensis]SDO48467.1 SIR2-like domain-containing protein [Alkalicoccus daliensis]